METNFIVVVSLVSFAVLFIMGIAFIEARWRKKPMRNFPINYRGATFWISRSVAVTLFTLCKDEFGRWCVLANMRGNGTPDFQGFWNAPCGYLDYNEDGVDACKRETFEETGIYVRRENINFLSVNSDPKDSNRQNVTLRYVAKLDGVTNDYKFDTSNSERNEVSDVKWIPIGDIDNYKWAFNHDKLIKDLTI